MSDPNRAAKKKARALATAEGIPYTEARRRLIAHKAPEDASTALSDLALLNGGETSGLPQVGWRIHPDHTWAYVAATSTIGANGTSPIELRNGLAGQYTLPEPTQDPSLLRTCFLQHSAVLLDRLPSRIAAPLLGHIYVAPLHRNPYALVITGPPATGKSLIALTAMHHFGETPPTIAGTATAARVRTVLNQIADAVVLIDDVDDTSRTGLPLDDLLRESHDTIPRDSLNPDLSIRTSAVRASVLVTTELRPGPGARRRALLVPIAASGDVDPSSLDDLNTPDSRNARATLLSSMISWAAQDLPATRSNLPAPHDRVSAASTGWRAMCNFLTHVGALSDAERRHHIAKAERGLMLAQVRHVQDADVC